MAPGSIRTSVGDGPQVVIGIAPPMIESALDGSDETPDMIEESEAPASVSVRAEGSIERDGLVSVRREGAIQRQVTVPVTVSRSVEEPAAESEAHETHASETAHDDVLDTPPPVAKKADPEAADSDPPAALSPAALAPEDPFKGPKVLDPDEISIPPIGDVADQFFMEGEQASQRLSQLPLVSPEEEWDVEKAKSSRMAAPEVVERRHRFTRWVRWAVAGAAVVCLAATVRSVTPKRASVAAVAKPAAPVATQVAVAHEEAAPKPIEEAEMAKPAETAKAEPAAAPVASAEPAKDEAKSKDDKALPSDDDVKTALTEKKTAQAMLERNKLDDAIAAGQKAVDLNPADGEAWLILGASYQQKGKLAEARKAFKECTEQGKRGPIGECRAMLRF